MSDKPRKIRVEGWIAPGPSPRGDRGMSHLRPGPEEDLAFLTGDFRIFQRKVGHRWSLDDFMTAWVAVKEARAFQPGERLRAADLGCGIGSVLMMVAWGCPDASCVGIEAQEISYGMALRSLEYNGIDDRCRVVFGDLREVAKQLEPRSFKLVTGTPPYIPLGSGLVSEKAQRRPCFFETRGGLEDYCLAASELLSDDGRFVFCAGAFPEGRGEDAARAAGLHVHTRVDVIPRDGKRCLLRVFVVGRAPATMAVERFLVRDRDGAVSSDMEGARVDLGIPPMVPPSDTARRDAPPVSPL